MKIAKRFVFTALLLGLAGCSDNDRQPDEVANKLVSALDRTCNIVLDVTDEGNISDGHAHKVYACELNYVVKGRGVRDTRIYFMVLKSSKSFKAIKESIKEDNKKAEEKEIYRDKGFYLTDGGKRASRKNAVSVFGESKSTNIVWFGDYIDSHEKADMVLLQKMEQLNKVVSNL